MLGTAWPAGFGADRAACAQAAARAGMAGLRCGTPAACAVVWLRMVVDPAGVGSHSRARRGSGDVQAVASGAPGGAGWGPVDAGVRASAARTADGVARVGVYWASPPPMAVSRR